MNQIQQHQLNMAKEVDRICKKYNLQYYIEGGTLLGAIRHQGFIPWDDDLDIDMPREDYDKFIKIAQKELGEKYFLQTWETNKNFVFPFAKIRENNTLYLEEMSKNVDIHHGIFIDIFPIDQLSNNNFLNKIITKKVIILRMLLLVKKKYIIESQTIIKKLLLKILKFLSLFLSTNIIIKIIKKMQYKYYGKNTNYVTNFSDIYFNKMIIDKNLIKEYISLKFEDTTLIGLKEYDKYLKFYFGDYMTPPPIDKRDNRHGIIKIKFND